MNRKECWPLQRGFDSYYGGLSGGFNYFKPGGNCDITQDYDSVETAEDFYTTDTFTNVACQFISNAVKKTIDISSCICRTTCSIGC